MAAGLGLYLKRMKTCNNYHEITYLKKEEKNKMSTLIKTILYTAGFLLTWIFIPIMFYLTCVFFGMNAFFDNYYPICCELFSWFILICFFIFMLKFSMGTAESHLRN